MKTPLHPLQENRAAFLAARYHAACRGQAGTGKTLIAIRAAEIVKARTALVICPAHVRLQWQKVITHELGADALELWHVISYNEAIRDEYKTDGNPLIPRRGITLRQKYDVTIIDECFPAGTLISTSTGRRRIADIAVGEYVLSCDFSTNALEYKKVVKTRKQPRKIALVEVTHDAGKFICTANHKIWTSEGYQVAAALSRGTILRTVPGAVRGKASRGINGAVLLREVLDTELDTNASRRRAAPETGIEAPRSSGVRMVQDREVHLCSVGQETVLRPFLQREVAHVPTRGGGESPRRASATPSLEARAKGPRGVVAHAHEQPDGEEGHKGQGASGDEGPEIRPARRERAFDGATENPRRTVGLAHGVRHKDPRRTGEVPRDTLVLQGGPGEPGIEAGCGSRRPDACAEKVASGGSAQDGGAEFSRVVGVKVLEPGDYGRLGLGGGADSVVYDFEVEDNHNYFANGVLVSNCHFLKTLTSGRTQAVFGPRGLARRARFKWALSGTMAPNGRPIELYPMLKALAPNFDIPFSKFTQRYCGAYFDGRGMCFDGATHLDELSEKLRDFMCHLSLNDLDPGRTQPVIERVPLALTAEDLREIHKEEDLIGARESRLSSRYEEYSQMGDTSRLLRLLSLAKYRSTVEFITQILQTYPKVVIFVRHVDLLERLQLHYQERSYNPVVKRGGMSQEVSDMMKHKFIYDAKCRIFIAQEDAAGTGLDGLQKAASIAIDVEPSWTPGVTAQKLARLDRIGQESDIVTYFMLYADGTLDEVKAHVHDRKERVIDRMEKDRFDVLKGFL